MNETVQRAAEILRAGGLVAFPTETVYGLGADAKNPNALKKIFAAKGRPADHPLIVHLPSAQLLEAWVREIPAEAHALAEAFWPGPLTLVFRRAPSVPDEVTGGQETVALRVPAHPLAQALLQAFGSGVAAPSANRFGRISPTTAAHVRAELGERVDMILDGGPCQVGLESTIVDVSGGEPRLLRPGGVPLSALRAVLGREVLPAAAASPRVSGSLESHYAPRTRAQLVDEYDAAVPWPAPLGVLARRSKPEGAEVARWLELPDDPDAYGQRLYAGLRELDEAGLALILIERVPESEAWLAVRDRLQRAAAQTERGEEVR